MGKGGRCKQGGCAENQPKVMEAKEARRDKKDEQLTKKIEETRAELKDDGHICAEAPAMITLPEFEEERMALMAEEHDILVDLVDHMHALSSRIDRLETTYKALAIEEKAARARPEATPTEETKHSLRRPGE